jgi:FkbM family methyltransferase
VNLDGSSAQAWRKSLLIAMYRLMHNVEQDNFDVGRYGEAARNAFYADHHAWYLDFVLANIDAFHAARQLLADGVSQGLFDQLVLFRLLGHHHVRLTLKNQRSDSALQVPAQWKIDETGDMGMFGPLSIYSVPHHGQEIWVKGWEGNVATTFLGSQYHFNRDGRSVDLHAGDHVIDGGACFGDTALAFAAAVGKDGFVYTFDPLPKHCQIINEVCAMNRSLAPRIKLFAVGLSDRNYDPPAASAAADGIDPGARLDDSLPTRTIDGLVQSSAIKRVDFIKMDIEGSELAALRGAEQSIRKWTPRLAISLYHRPEDLFSIPLWLNELGCNYEFTLDHYSIHHEETVLYAHGVP